MPQVCDVCICPIDGVDSGHISRNVKDVTDHSISLNGAWMLSNMETIYDLELVKIDLFGKNKRNNC